MHPVSALRIWACKQKRAMLWITCLHSSSCRYLGSKWGGLVQCLVWVRVTLNPLGHPCMVRSQFVSMYPRVCGIQFPLHCIPSLAQTNHKAMYQKRESSLNAISKPIWHMQILTRFYEPHCPTLFVRSTVSNICVHNLLEQATIPAKLRAENFGSCAEPVKLRRLLTTPSQHSPVRHGSFYTKHLWGHICAQSEGGCQTHCPFSWTVQIKVLYVSLLNQCVT